MALVSRTTALFTGFPGAPGYTRFHWIELDTSIKRQAALDGHRAFCAAFAATMKTTWTYQVQPTIQVYDIGTSELVREDSATAPPVVTGTGLTSAAYAGGTGIRIRWSTGQVFSGRKLAGQTFMVPMQNVSDPDGTLLQSARDAALAAATALISLPTVFFSIWGKRFADTGDPPPQTAGALFPVTSAIVPDKAAILKSRRD